jgi:hypothetical protein
MGTRLPSQNSFFHPEGPNIGPGSADNWFHKEGDLPPKTDLLHKGHSKGGKLVIVMVRVRWCSTVMQCSLLSSTLYVDALIPSRTAAVVS